MDDPRIQLKNPWLAALLAYLIPGAGHLYQGRLFKGVLYSACILGTFFWGMHLGEWKVVYFRRDAKETTYGYLAQVLAGLPALPALVQAKRYNQPENQTQTALQKSLSAPFRGTLTRRGEDGDFVKSEIAGTVMLEPLRGQLGHPVAEGRFVGTVDGEAAELPLGGDFQLGRPIMADRRRFLRSELASGEGEISGSIPRPFWNWFEVPLDDAALQDLNGRLGKRLDLAKVYTWIAALLNILVIWDALEGPAYGYGDKERRDEGTSKRRRKSEEPEPAVKTG